MIKRTIFTWGYQGQRPAYLAYLAEHYNATVIDVRYQPRSSQPGWNRSELSKLLEMRYLWIQELGNVNYDNDQEWLLRAPESGASIALPILERRDVILLCRCTVHERCHRSLVSDILCDYYWSHGARVEGDIIQVSPLLPESIQKHVDADQLQLF